MRMEKNNKTLDIQVVEDTIRSVLAFLHIAATQFSVYRRTKILEEYNKELVSFAEELEPDAALCCLDHLLPNKRLTTWDKQKH